MGLAYGAGVATRSKHKNGSTGNRTVILFIVGETDNNLIGPHILPNRLNGEE
jgi:hypothetical protein